MNTAESVGEEEEGQGVYGVSINIDYRYDTITLHPLFYSICFYLFFSDSFEYHNSQIDTQTAFCTH